MILYNEIFPEGDVTKGIYVGQNEVKFVNIGDKLVYDTFSHVTYDDPIIDISYPVMSRGGRSGTQWVSPTITYQQTVHTWGHSGNYYGSVIEEGSVSDFTVEGAILNSSGAWIDEDGIVYRESLNTTYKPSTWNIMEVTISAKINGKSSSSSVTVQMESNTRTKYGGITTYGSITAGNITNTVIPAKGTQGTYYTAIAEKGSQSYNISRQYYLYQTGAEETIFDASSGSINIDPVDEYGNICSSISINNCDSKGTTISEANVVKSQTVTWASLDGTASKNKTSTMYIYQAANYVTSVVPYASNSNYDHFYYNGTVSAAGGSLSPTVNGGATFNFSSGSHSSNGSTGNILGGTVSYKRTYSLTATTGASIDSTGKVTWTANTSTSKRSATVSSTLTVTYTHPSGINNGKAVSGTLNGTATCSQNADSITNSTVSYSGLKCTLTNNLTASGGSATVKVTTLKITTHTWASGKNPTYEYVNYYDVTSSATKTIDHATLFNTSGAVIEASTRFSISGATVSHSSMLDKVGIDKVCVKAVFSGLTAHSDYAGVQNSRTDRKELTNVSVSYANASYIGGVNIAPSKSATYKVTPTYTSGFSGTTTTSTVTPNIDSYSITGTGCSKGSTIGYIIWSSNPNTASRSATITGTVAHQSITSSFSTTAWQAAKPANTYGCDVTFVNNTSCVAQITFTNCETSFVNIPPNSTQYYTLIRAQGVSGSVIYASVSTPGTCTLKLSITDFYCMSPHTSTTCNITTS